jgi:ATP-dependent RNA helicase MSS116, mitochondrial
VFLILCAAGKTMAFLIPALENLLHNPRKNGEVSVLILSPTRELATQIAKEAELLLTHSKPPARVQVVVGGTSVSGERQRLLSKPADVLVRHLLSQSCTSSS